jgi:hypothetical protein
VNCTRLINTEELENKGCPCQSGEPLVLEMIWMN